MKNKITLRFEPAGQTCQTDPHTTIMDAARSLDIPMRTDCGGNGTCGKCRVFVDEPGHFSERTSVEKKHLAPAGADPHDRLACQAEIRAAAVVTIAAPETDPSPISTKTRITRSFHVSSPYAGSGAPCLGVAVDIGTTTLAVYLCDFKTGTVLLSGAAANPQRTYGEDVLSRITTVREDPGNLFLLNRLAVSEINALISALLADTGYASSDVKDVTLAGNTTMQHIFARLSPADIGVHPYQPFTFSAVETDAGKTGLALEEQTPVYIFPVISGFLGGDILAAFLADQSHKRPETTLIVDIGTNGELMLCTGSGLWAASCATGPALEGAQISSGMRAQPGAVSKVFIDPEKTDQIQVKTIMDRPPVGICGSGIIDALAMMRRLGIIHENGTFNTDVPGMEPTPDGTCKKFRLPGCPFHITLKDIRQIQLAKAALHVGIDALIKESGAGKIDRTILTGAFGASFDLENAVAIGMLPGTIAKGRLFAKNNLAGNGTIAALFDKGLRREIETLAGQVNTLELNSLPDFTLRFAAATRFPTLSEVL